MIVMGARRETARQGMSDVDRDTLLHLAFDCGNYAQAYEGEDYDLAVAREEEKRGGALNQAFLRAFTLGFFSSFELHEIPGSDLDSYHEAYFSPEGERVLALGMIDAHSPEEWEKLF